MSQVEDIRMKHADHEKRISALESLVNPLASEMKEAVSMKAAENLLEEPDEIQTGLPKEDTNPTSNLPPPTEPPAADLPPSPKDAEQQTVSEEAKEETNDGEATRV